ncbi:psiA family protein [Escherichia coli P0304816.3]|nr:psiA family protein [Escherichia coli P0304816.3]
MSAVHRHGSLSTEQQAAWRAVAETEKRRHQGNTLAEYPYAGAFFRCLNGSRRIRCLTCDFSCRP